MKHKLTNTSKRPLVLPFASGAVALDAGASADVDISEAAAARIARHGVVHAEKVAEPVKAADAPPKFSRAARTERPTSEAKVAASDTTDPIASA